MDLIKQLVSHLETEAINKLSYCPKSHNELVVKLNKDLNLLTPSLEHFLIQCTMPLCSVIPGFLFGS